MICAGKPSVSHDEVREILRESYGIREVESIEPLVSFFDQNFLVKVSFRNLPDQKPNQAFTDAETPHRCTCVFQAKSDGRRLLLKIINWKSSENRDLHGKLIFP